MPPRIHRPASTLIRNFSCSSKCLGQVSNIGRSPISIPPNAILTSSPDSITVQGPLGNTAVPLKPYIRLSYPKPDTLSVTVEKPAVKEQRQMWGTTRSLINNAIVGMTEGFTLPVYIVGVTYRVALEDDPRGTSDGNSGQRLQLKLGHSHSIYVAIPAHIKAEVPSPSKIVLSCTDKHLLGLFAAQIRKWRPPEPYKGKGVFVGKEQIRIKHVKKK